MSLNEQLQTTEATAKKYEDKNLSPRQEIAKLKKNEEAMQYAEKEVLHALMNAKQGYHEDVAKDFGKTP